MIVFLVILSWFSSPDAFGQSPQGIADPSRTPVQASVVFVLGEIRVPQMLPWAANLTLLTAIGDCQGFSDLGTPTVYLIREGVIILKTQGKHLMENDVPLKAKDVVYIGRIANVR